MLDIVYEDKYILAVHKPAGIPSQTASISQSDVVSMTEDYLRGDQRTSKRPFVGMINRLDQPVEGIVLMARDAKTAASLAEQLRDGMIEKRYCACVVPDSEGYGGTEPVSVSGTVGKSPIILTDHIYHDKKLNYSSIVPAGHKEAKTAKLEYTLTGNRDVAAGENEVRVALADIHLFTGRHHQIRVQMSHAGLPLLGDRKYGTEYVQNVSKLLKVSEVALCACQLTFTHPVTNGIINLRVKPQGMWYSLFQN